MELYIVFALLSAAIAFCLIAAYFAAAILITEFIDNIRATRRFNLRVKQLKEKSTHG